MVAEQQYSVIFSGALAEGFVAAEVKANIAQWFRLDGAAVEKLFGGRPCVVKKDLNKAQAQQLLAALTKLGAEASLGLQKPPGQTAAVAPTAGEAADLGLTLAPMQGYLLQQHERPGAADVEVSLDHLSLAAAEGNILHQSEQPPPVKTQVAVPDWELSAINPLEDERLQQ